MSNPREIRVRNGDTHPEGLQRRLELGGGDEAAAVRVERVEHLCGHGYGYGCSNKGFEGDSNTTDPLEQGGWYAPAQPLQLLAACLAARFCGGTKPQSHSAPRVANSGAISPLKYGRFPVKIGTFFRSASVSSCGLTDVFCPIEARTRPRSSRYIICDF